MNRPKITLALLGAALWVLSWGIGIAMSGPRGGYLMLGVGGLGYLLMITAFLIPWRKE